MENIRTFALEGLLMKTNSAMRHSESRHLTAGLRDAQAQGKINQDETQNDLYNVL